MYFKYINNKVQRTYQKTIVFYCVRVLFAYDAALICSSKEDMAFATKIFDEVSAG